MLQPRTLIALILLWQIVPLSRGAFPSVAPMFSWVISAVAAIVCGVWGWNLLVSIFVSLAEGVIYFDYVVPGGDEFRERYRKKFYLCNESSAVLALKSSA